MALRGSILGLLVLFVAAVAPAHASTTVGVDVGSDYFNPSAVQASAGDTIHWTWSSGTHNVIAYVGATFQSPTQSTGSYDVTFAGGTILYYCSIHASFDPVRLVCDGSMCGSITDKTAAPSAPAIDVPAQSATLTNRTVRISGTSDEATTITVSENGAAVGSAVASSSGVWSLDASFANGSHAISSRATDVDGRASGQSATRTFVVDVADPQPPSVTMDQGSPQLFAGNGYFSGSAADDIAVDHVDVVFQSALGGATVVRADCACGRRSVSWLLEKGIPQGVFFVQAVAFDQAGLTDISPSITMVNV